MATPKAMWFLLVAIVAAALATAKIVGMVVLLSRGPEREAVWFVKQGVYAATCLAAASWCWFRFRQVRAR